MTDGPFLSGPLVHSPVRAVHVVSDQTGATQAISFANPLAGAVPVTFADCPKGADDLGPLLPPTVPDVLVMSRLTSPLGAPLARWARTRGVPVVFHIDDDLLDVPEALGREKTARYRDPALLRGLRANLDAADLVYASTGPLAERLRGHGVRAPVVAGTIYCSVDPARLRAPSPGPSAAPVLGYMGTGGHEADLTALVPVVERLMNEVPVLQFEAFGTIPLPARLARFEGRARRHAPVRDYAGFLDRLGDLGWWVGLAPLLDHPFNRCKADTKWVEYSLAGVAVVAQDLPVYHRACADGAGRLAASPEAWATHLRDLLASRSEREAVVAAARAKLGAGYAHAALREQVMGVFGRARALAAARAGTAGRALA